ncbi:AP-5 complex subunit mu-1 [Biomphalaria pfeifferi]|uniref:AP-5 complex subunit mu-1 n=1 Tax=Biomphalaria pfeifferi TaxID=112525 RepID=A0AAD8F0N0_BIOPF|nr:AP-5 complex subunit mu-1 [Biomphalaria pfeifferi]
MTVAIRYIWIIKLSPNANANKSTVTYIRRFPTVEKRANLLAGNIPVPDISQLHPLLVQEISQTYNFLPSRDRCDSVVQKPVYQIQTENGFLWPVVALERANILYCCLPLVEPQGIPSQDITKMQLINIPSISLGFSLLCVLSEFLKVPSQELAARVQDLTAFINEAAPFGILRDVSTENIISKLSNKSINVSKTQKLAAWRASNFKGRQTLQLIISEHISASQCAKETWQDSLQAFGDVTCRAELEGGMTDVTISLSHQGSGINTPLDLLVVHPCVQKADWQDLNLSHDLAPRRIRFSPPVESFTLCHYTVKRLLELPVFGVYHMKPEETRATINIQLKLNDQIKNSFEFCELRIPFYTRAPILNYEGTPTQGSISLSSNKKELIWNIGQKFTSKDQQAILAATVVFSGSDQGLPAPTVEDAFCRGNNSYAQLSFKIPDFTHSGCGIDAKTVQLLPSTKFKLNLSREYSTVDYKIWNSIGEALST